jgi:hypothetical protein
LYINNWDLQNLYAPIKRKWQRKRKGYAPIECIFLSKKKRPAGEEPCGIVLRRRSSRRKVAELGARTHDLVGARTRPWAAAILVDTSSLFFFEVLHVRGMVIEYIYVLFLAVSSVTSLMQYVLYDTGNMCCFSHAKQKTLCNKKCSKISDK